MRTNKSITRIHSLDLVNDKNWLNRPKMDNFWFKKIKIFIARRFVASCKGAKK